MATDSINNGGTPWSFNSDIYDIENTLVNVRNRYIEDESEDTLNAGLFGFIMDTEAKKIQTSVVLTGELGNEMFPSRAKLTKNITTHAIDCNITDINAKPAKLTIDIGIKTSDFELYMDANERFYLDHMSPLFIENIEFHFDYDIILQRAMNSTGEYTYSAHYDMSTTNRISDITEPYLVQPFQTRIGNDEYIVFQAEVRQYSIEKIEDRIISESVVENKTYTFAFENQLVDFDVYLTTNGTTTRLLPFLYGSEVTTDLYCWYEYISDTTVRLSFDGTSYLPGLNTDINIIVYTSIGEQGNFTYNINPAIGGLYIDLSSEVYNYDSITCYMIPAGDSQGGQNKMTKAEMQRQIPIMRNMRGNITTDQDLENYFTLSDTDSQRIIASKKVDNQIARVWYAYFLMKDENNFVIPTNTIDIKVDITSNSFITGEDGRYILPAGTVFKISNNSDYAEIIDAANVPELYTDEYFNSGYYYMSLYNILIDTEPLYTAYYMTISNLNQYFTFSWVNEESILQFVSTSCNFNRSLLTDQSEYKLSFLSAQSIANDYGLYEEDPETHIVTNKMAAVLVMYVDNEPYRWLPATLSNYDKDTFVSTWSFSMTTDNAFDTSNKIKILDLHIAGSGTDVNYGYLPPNVNAKLYLLAKLDSEYGRYDLDSIAPDVYNGYTVTNIYNIKDGLTFYTNFTNIMNTKISNVLGSNSQYIITGIPVGGMHYMNTEEAVVMFTNTLNEKKKYIDKCLEIIDNTTDIDFKFYNTYGKAKTYTIGNSMQTSIKHVDLTLKFRVKLKSTTDVYTRDDITIFIKNYLENLNKLGDIHFPNLITDLTNEFNDRIQYIEFCTFNNFTVGDTQHIILKDDLSIADIPEFINIRNHYDVAGNLVPWIDLEVLY